MNNPGGLQVPQAQFPALNSQQRLSPNVPAGKGDSTKGRRKVGLTPGHSLMDWVRLANQKGRVLNGLNGSIVEIPATELRRHDKVDDAWTCIRGKVYNITPYMDFHPGGVDELMRAAGKDGTDLFNEYHQWVNIESLMDKCLIGKLRVDAVPGSHSRTSKKPVTAPFLKPPETQVDGKPPSKSETVTHEGPPKARYDWYQKDDAVFITVYAKCMHIAREHVIVDQFDQTFRAILYLDDHVYTVCFELSAAVQRDIQVRVRSGPVNRADFILKKCKPEKWANLGEPKEHNDELQPLKERALIFRKCKVADVVQINHDTKVITCELPEDTVMHVPLGYHVYLQMDVDGTPINRPYTVILPSLQNQNDRNKECHSGRFLHFMIKIYSDGLLTPHIGNLKPGSCVQISDFEGSFVESRLKKCTDLVLVAAGTGLTPMIRLINQTMVGNLQKSCVKLLFFNKTEGDILWRNELEVLEKQQKSFKLINVLSDADNSWPWLRGRVTENLLKHQLVDQRPTDSVNPLICVCGPTPFTQATFRILKNLGYSEDSFHLFTS